MAKKQGVKTTVSKPRLIHYRLDSLTINYLLSNPYLA